MVRELCVIWNACRVRQQMMNRDIAPGRWAILDILGDAIRYVQLVLLLEDQNAHGRELFGHRGQAENRVRRVCDAVFAIGESIAFGKDDIPAGRNQNTSAKLLFLRQLGKIFIRSRTEIDRISRERSCRPQKRNQGNRCRQCFQMHGRGRRLTVGIQHPKGWAIGLHASILTRILKSEQGSSKLGFLRSETGSGGETDGAVPVLMLPFLAGTMQLKADSDHGRTRMDTDGSR